MVEADYKKALSKCITTRHMALAKMLWSTGIRREEIARASVEWVDFVGGFILVPSMKNGRAQIRFYWLNTIKGLFNLKRCMLKGRSTERPFRIDELARDATCL